MCGVGHRAQALAGPDRVGTSLVEKGTLVTCTVSRKPLVRFGATALLAALLAGCGTATAGSAAVVGGRRISVSDVQSATVDAQAWVGEGSQITPTQVLYFLAIGPYIQETASRYGVGISEEDARASLKTRVGAPSVAGVDVIRTNASLAALEQRLGEERIAEALGEVGKQLVADGFEMNPRFGRFDPKTGRVTMPQPNWLVGSPPSEEEAVPSPSN